MYPDGSGPAPPYTPAMFWIVGLPLAWAGLVATPPEDAREVAVLACPPDDCSDAMFWVTHEPALERVPILVIDALLAENAAEVAQGEAAAAEWRAALERARTAVIDQKWSVADGALDDAERILGEWRGTATTDELFALWFTRGAAALGSGRRRGTDAFRTAAVLAWNRSVAPPAGLEGYASPYYAALADLLDEGTGTLVVPEGGAAARYRLDGVDLGPPPIRVQLFPGVHRLTAADPGSRTEWRGDVTIQPGRTSTLRARFPTGEEAARTAEALARAVDEHRLDPEVAELLTDWGVRHGLRTIRLLRLDPRDPAPSPAGRPGARDDGAAGHILPVYELREVTYDPVVRRFSERQ